MKRALLLSVLLACGIAPAWGATPVVVQDFEKAALQPGVWVVGIPNENASVQLSTFEPHDGQRCLKLHYHFLAAGGFQYLGIPNKVRVLAPVHKVRYWLKGDGSKCSYGLQVTDAGGETHQYRSLSSGTGQGGIVDFSGWKEVVFDLDAPHETWGGDRNGKLDHPIAAIIFTVGQPVEKTGGKEKLLPAEGDLYFDSLAVDSERSVEETLGCQVSVLSPEYCSDVRGDTPVTLAAPGFKSVTVKCWKQGAGLRQRFHPRRRNARCERQGLVPFPGRCLPARSPHGDDQRRRAAGSKTIVICSFTTRAACPGTKGCPRTHRPRPTACRWSSPTTSRARFRFPAPIPRPTITTTSRPTAGRTSARLGSPVTTSPTIPSARWIPICGSGPARRRRVPACSPR